MDDIDERGERMVTTASAFAVVRSEPARQPAANGPGGEGQRNRGAAQEPA